MNTQLKGRMLKAPPLISLDQHFSAFQDRSETGTLHIVGCRGVALLGFFCTGLVTVGPTKV